METAAKATLLKKLDGLQKIPTIPTVLSPLLRCLQQPMEQLDVERITSLISQDESLSAQCLQMANSPLFGHWQKINSLHNAILGLGLQRVADLALSCEVLNMMPRECGIDPVVFWEHALGCALVSRHLARRISYPDPGKAYLAGLLHDLGIIVNLWVLPKESGEAFELARAKGLPLHEAEEEVFGFTHCESGQLLAERWGLSADLNEVIAFHNMPEKAMNQAALVGLVQISDLLCRMTGLNHGYMENREVNLFELSGFSLLSKHCKNLKDLDWARITFELDSYMDEVHALVHAIYRP
jgi:HD-like signal output (HDOD) protein